MDKVERQKMNMNDYKLSEIIYHCEKGINIMRIKECELKTNDVIIDRWEKFTGQKAVKIN